MASYRYAFVCTVLLLAHAESEACLDGAPTPGIASGPVTVQAVPKNLPTLTVHSAELCQPQSFHIEGESQGGSAFAAFTGNNFGIASFTSASANGPGTGTTFAGSQGSVSIVFRVDTLAGFSGGAQTGITVHEHVELSGSSTATGAGAAIGGTYNTSIMLRPLDSSSGISLGGGGGSILTSIDDVITRETSIELNKDYVLSFVHTQNASAANGQDSMGIFGSSAISAKTQWTFAIEPTIPDPNLALIFPMVQQLGLAEPDINATIAITTFVPVPPVFFLLPACFTLLASCKRASEPANGEMT